MHLLHPDTTAALAQRRHQDLLAKAERERQLRALKPSLKERLTSWLYALTNKLEPQQAPTRFAG